MNSKTNRLSWQFSFQFALDDFRNKYSGSLVGAAWAFTHPLMTIVIYWFIFQVGFQSQPVAGYPYVLWLISGIIPWFFVSDTLACVTPVLAEYSYLVKKVVFPIDILPFTRILSNLFVHIFLVVFAFVLFGILGYLPDAYYLQIPYYLLYTILLTAGLGYLLAALYPFFKDLLQLVSIFIQVAFWLTPIVWDFKIMPGAVRTILALNPFYYVVQGYRDAFVNKQVFWENWKMGIWYWAIALLFLFLGRKAFRKMKPHFADVL